MIKQYKSPVERLRKPISALVAASLIAAALFTVPAGFQSNFSELLEYLGFSFLIIAGLGRVWCLIYIAGRKDHELCQEGPYSLCRNPLYLFSFIGVLGICLALQSLLLTVIMACIFNVYYTYVIRSEEARLSLLFGEEYLDYRRSTPRLMPAFSGYRQGQPNIRISTPALERGLREVFWFFAAIVMIDAIELIHEHGSLIAFTLPF